MFTNDQLITKYAYQNIGLYSQTIIAEYCRNIRMFFDFQNKPLNKITNEDIITWLDYLCKTNIGEISLRRKRRSILRFSQWCFAENLLEHPFEIPPFNVIFKEYRGE